jgi:hypothetical protein
MDGRRLRLFSVVLGKYFEGAIIAGLLVFTTIAAGFADNGNLGYFREGRAQATLAVLNSWNASAVAIMFGKA